MPQNNMKYLLLGLGIFFFFCLRPPSMAQTVPSTQQISAQERARQLQEQSQKLKEKVRQPISKVQKQNPIQVPQNPHAPQILIKKINVEASTLFQKKSIEPITHPYENKKLTLNDMQKVADAVTDLYRQKGYITSRAYVPPQKIENGVLEIKIVEAKIGTIQIQGNRYFKSKLLRRYLTIKSGQVFNYKVLKENLENLNSHPDRSVRAVLAPGQKPGTTDVVLDEKDFFPVHISVGFNNFLSYYVRHSAYSTTFTHNNFLGQDDILTVSYARAQGNNEYNYSARYLYPVTHRVNMGFSYVRSNIVLGRDLRSADARGESTVYGLFGDQKLIKKDNLDLDLTYGFDYKNVNNYLAGNLSSRDNLRILKIGFDIDRADDFGRTIISDEADYGIPGILGGTGTDQDLVNNIPTSRTGADGQFFLHTLNILRLQNLPLGSTLLWKNQLQFSSSKLTATEEFQAGGPANNRGFGVVDRVGDAGYAMSWELGLPPYFIPKSWQIPFFKTNAYQALRFTGFYDWTNVHFNELQPGDKKNDTISSAGLGASLNIKDDLFFRYEIGWPIHGRPTDGKRLHQWLQMTMTF